MNVLVSLGVGAKAWLVTLAMMAAHGTLLAIVALVLTRGRSRPAWQAGVWLVVLGKFALPWGPAMPWSLSDLWSSLVSRSGDVVTATVPPALEPPAPQHAWPAIGWLALAIAWAIGATIVIVRAGSAHRREGRFARAAQPAPESARLQLAALAARLRVRAPVLAIGSDSVGPHVVGIVRPIIIVPPALLAEPAFLEAALLHELAHVRRRDGLARMLQVGATALLFFWPVVRLVGRRLDHAREAACDAWALEATQLPRPAYARLLVQMAALRAPAPALAMPHALDHRIATVLGPPVTARISMPLRIALAVWIVLALGGARTAEARGDRPVCKYTPQLAEALFQAHPEADLDGDGELSRDEACDLQSELRRQVDVEQSQLDASLLEQPLCCNCDWGEAYSSPEVASCQGADR